MKKKVFGIDIVAILFDIARRSSDLKSVNPFDVIEHILTFSSWVKDIDIYLISECNQETQEKVWGWLHRHDFCAMTGIPSQHVLFCKELHEKKDMCRRLGVTHFIDIRTEAVFLIDPVQYLYLIRPHKLNVQRKFDHRLGFVRVVGCWEEFIYEAIVMG